MSIVITASTGNIGRPLTDSLLTAGRNVTLLVRNPAKVEDFAARGATVIQADQTDEASVIEATKNCETLFWLNPPKLDAEDFMAYYAILARVAAKAVTTNGIQRVVLLSTVGAHLDIDTGVIRGLHETEKILDGTTENITFLRPGYFMENLLAQIQPIMSMNSIFLPVSHGATIPPVATRDVAEIAANILLDSSWSGRNVVEIAGPAMSFGEIAGVIGMVLGKTIQHVEVTAEQAIESMMGMGLSRDSATKVVDMHACIDAGNLDFESPDAVVTTPTDLETFVREVMLAMIDRAETAEG
jgi:uncharacterized protein YbjT (DUF2867 family)